MSPFKALGEGLQREWIKMEKQWVDTRQLWQDSVALRFERKIWKKWEKEVSRSLKSIQKLDQILDESDFKTRK